MLSKRLYLGFLLVFILGCQIGDVKVYEIVTPQAIEIPQPTAVVIQPTATLQPQTEVPPADGSSATTEQPPAQPTAEPTEAPPGMFAGVLGAISSSDREGARTLHGILFAIVMPFLFCGLPWILAEIYLATYLRPKSTDLTQILIKAKDGLFINANISMTARRSLTLASIQMTWPQLRDVVEKAVEQELIQKAQTFRALDDLENNINDLANGLGELSIIDELARDFGIEIMRFNIEIRYPQATIDAVNRRAEAAAGGTAFLAYAAGAGLDPHSPESRELYQVYQETRGQVDAARNLGGGITSLASLLNQKMNLSENKEDDGTDE